MILLDTHVWIWLAADTSAINPVARKAIEEASNRNRLFLSPISLWEIALQSSRGKLHLSLPLRNWLQRTEELTQINLVPISAEIACNCAELPAAFHGDPADRIIAATARSEEFTLVTHDKVLLQLAKQGYFKALAT